MDVWSRLRLLLVWKRGRGNREGILSLEEPAEFACLAIRRKGYSKKRENVCSPICVEHRPRRKEGKRR